MMLKEEIAHIFKLFDHSSIKNASDKPNAQVLLWDMGKNLKNQLCYFKYRYCLIFRTRQNTMGGWCGDFKNPFRVFNWENSLAYRHGIYQHYPSQKKITFN